MKAFHGFWVGIAGAYAAIVLAGEQPDRAGAAASSVAPKGRSEISLFNGRNFDGWVMTDGSPVNDHWEVIDGTIHLKPHAGSRAGSIRTIEAFECFELEFEWRVGIGGNSGVKYLAKEAESPFGRHLFGCEYQLLDDVGHKNGRTPAKTAGSLYDLYPADPAAKELRPAGEFNHARVVCKDGRIEHWLNGKKVVEAVIGSDDWEARRRRSKLAEVTDFARGPGVILLQEHLSEAWFRNLRLTRLPAAGCRLPAAGLPDDNEVGDVEALLAETHAASLALREKLLRDTIARSTAWPGDTWGDNLWTLAALRLNEKTDDANDRLLEAAGEYISVHRVGGNPPPPTPER